LYGHCVESRQLFGTHFGPKGVTSQKTEPSVATEGKEGFTVVEFCEEDGNVRPNVNGELHFQQKAPLYFKF